MPFRDSFLVYGILRPAVLFGVRINPVIRALGSHPGDKILDVGCGFGVLVKYFKDCDYTGIDSDPARIDWARKEIGETPTRRFVVGNACRLHFASKSFDRAIGFGILHHLSDDTAKQCIRELSRLSKKRVAFADPVYSKHHAISNFLCKHDRGAYVRNREGYLGLCDDSVKIIQANYYHAYSGVAKYFLMAHEPRATASMVTSSVS